MTNTNDEADREAIRMVIARQFSSRQLECGPRCGTGTGFRLTSFAGAQPFSPPPPHEPPFVRPPPVSVPDFVARMKTAAARLCRSFEEALLGIQIRLYGKVAVALAVLRAASTGRLRPNVPLKLCLLPQRRTRLGA